MSRNIAGSKEYETISTFVVRRGSAIASIRTRLKIKFSTLLSFWNGNTLFEASVS